MGCIKHADSYLITPKSKASIQSLLLMCSFIHSFCTFCKHELTFGAGDGSNELQY